MYIGYYAKREDKDGDFICCLAGTDEALPENSENDAFRIVIESMLDRMFGPEEWFIKEMGDPVFPAVWDHTREIQFSLGE
jgi:hypothetical protein